MEQPTERTEQAAAALSEVVEPKKGSAPLIYGLSLLGVLAAVLVRNLLLAAGLTWAGNVAVALLAALAFWVIRTRLVSYRYTLTDSYFAVERITGKKPLLAARIALDQTEFFDPARPEEQGVKTNVLTCLGKAGASELRFSLEGESRKERVLFHPSESMKQALRARIAAAKTKTSASN